MHLVNNIEILHPWAFVTLLIYPLLLRVQAQESQVFYFSNMKMLQKVVASESIFLKFLKFLALFCMVLALAGPVKKQSFLAHNSKQYEISLVLDVSLGMRDDDKFKITKKIVQEFIKRRKNDRIALSVFADFAYVAVPLTYDKRSLLDILKYIRVGLAGYRNTALYEALYLSGDIFKKSRAKNKIVILLTDGLNTVHTLSLETAIEKVKKNSLKVYTIGIGDEVKGNDDLAKIAKATNGKFYEAKKPEELQKIYAEIDSLEKSTVAAKKRTYYIYYFQYPLLIALLALFVLLFTKRGGQ